MDKEKTIEKLQSMAERAEEFLGELNSLTDDLTMRLISEKGEQRYYTVNTNKSYDDHSQYMVENKRAAAFYDKKGKLNNIRKGDVVFLYENGVGIIGCGVAKSGAMDATEPSHLFDAKHIRYIDLDNFIQSTMSAAQINDLPEHFPFRGTCSLVRTSAGSAILKALQNTFSD